MANWKHKLKIKDIFMDYDGIPSSEETTEMAKAVIAKLNELKEKVASDDNLVYELEQIIEEFECIDESDSEDDAQDQFNFALNELYSVGDSGHRIWVG